MLMNNFLTKFRQIVKKYPKNIAILTNGKHSITYQDLYQSVINVAEALKLKKVKKGDIVAISLEKSPEYIISLIAIWFVGAAFMPLPPSLPRKRALFILKDASPKVIICKSDSTNIFRRYRTKIINIKNAIASDAKENGEIDNILEPEDLAYVIYTSGSTGVPKGVMINHKGILNFLEQQIKLFKLNASSRSLFFLSINFDASISEIGTTLLSGAALCIETLNSIEVAAKLPEILSKRKITHIDIPPSLLEILDINKISHPLKTIVIGGEICSVETIKKWAKKFRVINIYGPTEVTVCTSMVLCDPDTWNGPDIGTPIAKIKYKIINKELFISGIGLARGYLNQKKLNREKFVRINGVQYYRTGDIVRKIKNKIYFVGRRDRQIKIRGWLVAPEEIEMQLQNHESVMRAAVIVNPQSARKELIAFVELRKNKLTSSNSIKEYLKKSLPYWMIPNNIFILDKLPTGTNGKIDYENLNNLINKPTSTLKKKNLGKVDEFTNKLKEVWQLVLNKSNIGIDEDFFSLGGDSLAIIQVVTEAKKHGIQIPIGLISRKKTIRKIANWHKKHRYAPVSDGIYTKDLKKDAEITNEWKRLFDTSSSLISREDKGILITGASGFLGIHVLKELLVASKREIFVLIRSNDISGASKKVRKQAKKHDMKLTNHELKRIKPLCGNIEKNKLGLSAKDYKIVSHRVSDIYHCAAIVNMVETYEKLKGTNVDGTKNVVKLALTGARKKIHYASTLSVFVATNKNTGVVLENDSLSKIRIVYGGYAQTKWVAERFLQQIPKDVLNINIFRFGLITGNSKSGKYSSHDYLDMFVRGIISLGSVPKGNHKLLSLDVTPIDYASKAMVLISMKSDSGVYHIANKSGFTLEMILSELLRRRVIIKKLPPSEWLNNLSSKNLSVEESAAFAALCRLLPRRGSFEHLRSMDLFQATGIVFDQANTRRLLKNTHIKLPRANAMLLGKYLRHIF